MADAINCDISNQNTPNGYNNIKKMLKVVLAKGVKVKICSSYAEARGLKSAQLIESTEINTMDELTKCVVESD